MAPAWASMSGGNVSFDFDATKAIHRDTPNTIVVHAFDDTASGLQPLGKQSITGKSESIFYTPTTGIWQTVWLEGVGESYISQIRIEPRPESNVALMSVDVEWAHGRAGHRCGSTHAGIQGGAGHRTGAVAGYQAAAGN